MNFAAVLVDAMMPRIDGLEATRRIRTLEHADARIAPIIGTSANTFSDDVAAATAAGMTDYVVKPVGRGKLMVALARAARA